MSFAVQLAALFGGVLAGRGFFLALTNPERRREGIVRIAIGLAVIVSAAFLERQL